MQQGVRYALAGLVFLAATTLHAQPNWIKVTDSTAFSSRDSSPNASVVHEGVVYVLAGYGRFDKGWESRSDTWRSVDGMNWELVNSSPPYSPYSLFVSFKGSIWAYGDDGNFRSTDGKKWDTVATNHFIPGGARGVVHEDAIFVVYGRTVLRSLDGENFEVLTANALWSHRYWPGLVSFKNRLWFFGGGDGYLTGLDYYYNDVWSSNNGVEWQFEGHADWPGRFWFSYSVFAERLWILGGWDYHQINNSEFGNMNDVWYTSDGVSWEYLETDSIFENRHASFTWIKDGYLYLSSGYGHGGVSRMYNDVWRLQFPRGGEFNIAYGDTLPLSPHAILSEPKGVLIERGQIVGA